MFRCLCFLILDYRKFRIHNTYVKRFIRFFFYLHVHLSIASKHILYIYFRFCVSWYSIFLNVWYYMKKNIYFYSTHANIYGHCFYTSSKLHCSNVKCPSCHSNICKSIISNLIIKQFTKKKTKTFSL